MDVLFPLAEGSALEYLTRPSFVFWASIAAMAIGPAAATAYFVSRTRTEELRTIAELARAGHTADEIERILKATKSKD